MLAALTAGAAIESVATSRPAESLFVDGVTASPATLWDVTCPRVDACIAVGELQQQNRNQAVVIVQQRDGAWSAPIPMGPWVTNGYGGPAWIACSFRAVCVTSQPETASLSLISPLDGRSLGSHAVFPPISPQINLGESACSPGSAFCWTIVSQALSPSRYRTGHIWDYVIGEHNGRWLAPYPIGGPDLRIDGRRPELIWSTKGLSCWSATSCTVAAFVGGAKVATIVQTEVNGSWGPATIVPGSVYSPSSKNTAPYFRFSVIPAGSGLACSSRGTCVLGGEVTNSSKLQTGAVEQEVDGRWLRPVTGLGVSAPYVHSVVLSVACHGSALCVVEGISGLPNGRDVPFVQAEVHGHWQSPVVMTGLGRTDVSVWQNGAGCPTASTCDVFGSLSGGQKWNPAYVATYVGGQWHYSLLKIHRETFDLQVTGMSCSWKTCWITAFVSRGGIVLPFPAFK